MPADKEAAAVRRHEQQQGRQSSQPHSGQQQPMAAAAAASYNSVPHPISYSEPVSFTQGERADFTALCSVVQSAPLAPVAAAVSSPVGYKVRPPQSAAMRASPVAAEHSPGKRRVLQIDRDALQQLRAAVELAAESSARTGAAVGRAVHSSLSGLLAPQVVAQSSPTVASASVQPGVVGYADESAPELRSDLAYVRFADPSRGISLRDPNGAIIPVERVLVDTAANSVLLGQHFVDRMGSGSAVVGTSVGTLGSTAGQLPSGYSVVLAAGTAGEAGMRITRTGHVVDNVAHLFDVLSPLSVMKSVGASVDTGSDTLLFLCAPRSLSARTFPAR